MFVQKIQQHMLLWLMIQQHFNQSLKSLVTNWVFRAGKFGIFFLLLLFAMILIKLQSLTRLRVVRQDNW